MSIMRGILPFERKRDRGNRGNTTEEGGKKKVFLKEKFLRPFERRKVSGKEEHQEMNHS